MSGHLRLQQLDVRGRQSDRQILGRSSCAHLKWVRHGHIYMRCHGRLRQPDMAAAPVLKAKRSILRRQGIMDHVIRRLSYGIGSFRSQSTIGASSEALCKVQIEVGIARHCQDGGKWRKNGGTPASTTDDNSWVIYLNAHVLEI